MTTITTPYRMWNKPAHVIFGAEDATFTEKQGHQFAEHISRATINIIEGEGHRPLLRTGISAGLGEHRSDEFAELVLRLISEE